MVFLREKGKSKHIMPDYVFKRFKTAINTMKNIDSWFWCKRQQYETKVRVERLPADTAGLRSDFSSGFGNATAK